MDKNSRPSSAKNPNIKARFHTIKPFEAVIIVLVLIGGVAAMLILNRSGGSRTAVIRCGDIRHELSLGEDGVFGFDGIDAEFEVKDGKIRLTNASCPDKLCEKTGFIGSAGQSIICVPNRITVSVSSADDSVDVTVG